MCSIAGAYFFKDLENFDCCRSTVEKIIQKTISRGPDSQNIFADKSARVILGHARLAIVDCEGRSDQPLFSSDGKLAIVFNGEIYNYKSLRIDLERLGYIFNTSSDTEVLLHAFQEWGMDLCLEKLDGIFAFAVFDFQNKTLSMARDRFGVKPLFFAIGKSGVYFSSNARALLNWPEVSPEFSAQGIWHYLTLMAFPAPFTAFENVFAIPAGYCAVFKGSGQYYFKRWYRLEERIWAARKDSCSIDYCQAVLDVEKIFEKAVEKRVASEVKGGIFLSGGLDSSLISAIASKYRNSFYRGQINSFNISFDFDKKNCEKEFASLVANKFGFSHRSKIVDQKEFRRAFVSMSKSLDLPVGDPVNIPFLILSSLAKNEGLKVIFVGEGADELFGGYSWYFKLARLERIINIYSPKLLSRLFSRVSGMIGREFLAQVLQRHSLGQELFWTSASLFSEQDKLDCLAGRKGLGSLKDLVEKNGLLECFAKVFKNKEFTPNEVVSKIMPDFQQGLSTSGLIDYFVLKLKSVVGQVDPLLKYSYIDFILRIPNLLMSRVDQMSMANSLEVREPFLDAKMVEFVLGLPTEVRLKNYEQKPILKSILTKYFPQTFIDRKKIGFATPVEKLF